MVFHFFWNLQGLYGAKQSLAHSKCPTCFLVHKVHRKFVQITPPKTTLTKYSFLDTDTSSTTQKIMSVKNS